MKPLYVLAAVISIFSTNADAQTAGFQSDEPEGTFSLSSGPSSVATLASVPSPAYYRVCIDGQLGSALRIRVSAPPAPVSYLTENSCTDLLVSRQLKVGFAPDSMITNVLGRYQLLGFRQAVTVGPPDR